MPPVKAEMLCSSEPLARATSSTTWTRRGLDEASGIMLLILVTISDALAEGACDVAFNAKYTGKRERGIMVKGACSSLSNSCALKC